MVIRGVTALFAAGVGLAMASGANAQLMNHRDLSLATALAIATAASDHCKAQGYHVSVAVVGREAQTIVQLRGDGSPPHRAACRSSSAATRSAPLPSPDRPAATRTRPAPRPASTRSRIN